MKKSDTGSGIYKPGEVNDLAGLNFRKEISLLLIVPQDNILKSISCKNCKVPCAQDHLL
jgi:hypothetical protein